MPSTCCWIKQPATHDAPAVYCSQPTKRYYVIEPDGRRYSKHYTYCPEHEEIILRAEAADAELGVDVEDTPNG